MEGAVYHFWSNLVGLHRGTALLGGEALLTMTQPIAKPGATRLHANH